MSTEIQALERNIKEAKAIADVGGSLERLMINRDFKKVILEGYFEKEAVRLVHLKADPNMQTPEKQAGVMKDIDSIGGLVQYFHAVFQKAQMATNSVAASEEALTELAAEELTND